MPKTKQAPKPRGELVHLALRLNAADVERAKEIAKALGESVPFSLVLRLAVGRGLPLVFAPNEGHPGFKVA